MSIVDYQLEKRPFAPGEKRALMIRNPGAPGNGSPEVRVEATHKRTGTFGRHYEMVAGKKQPPVFIQLNHGNPADDERRLIAIAEDLLSAENAPLEVGNSGGEP